MELEVLDFWHILGVSPHKRKPESRFQLLASVNAGKKWRLLRRGALSYLGVYLCLRRSDISGTSRTKPCSTR